MKKYVFKPYNKIFPELFDIEKARIISHVSVPLAIEHIGSTAIPDLGGKGIIDIAIGVNKQELDSVLKQLQSLGYEFRPTFSTANRLYFITYLPDPEEETRRYHIHLTYPENSEWKEFIGFRDYLRNHPKELQEYAEIKKQAAFEANHEGERYRKIKEPMFKKINSLINKTNFKALIAILTFYGWMGALLADQENIVYQVEYLYPVDDDSVIPLPFITLRGKLIRHTFP